MPGTTTTATPTATPAGLPLDPAVRARLNLPNTRAHKPPQPRRPAQPRRPIVGAIDASEASAGVATGELAVHHLKISDGELVAIVHRPGEPGAWRVERLDTALADRSEPSEPAGPWPDA